MSDRFLFFAPFGAWAVHTQVGAVLAAALKLRGADVCVVRCDGLYAACDVLAWSAERAKEHCALCSGPGSQMFESLGIPMIQLRATLTDAERTAARDWANGLADAELCTAVWNDLPI